MIGRYRQTAVSVAFLGGICEPCGGKCSFLGFPSPVANNAPQLH